MRDDVATVVPAAPSNAASGDFPLEVFSDIVVVEQIVEEKSAGGILIAGTEESKWPMGRVVAVGPGRMFEDYLDASGSNRLAYFVPTKVKVGDFVAFGKYQSGGEPLEWNGRKFLMCREGDLAGRTKSGEAVRLRRAA